MSTPTVELLQQHFEIVDVNQLQLYPTNARRGDVDVLDESLEALGFFGALVVQRSTSYVLVGNHRLMRLREHGVRQVPVLWVDVDDDRAKRIALIDNRASDLAGWDYEQLAAEISELIESELGLVATGFTDADAQEILAAAAVAPQLTDPDDAPDYPNDEAVIPTRGDVWRLGPHRLVCGDATDAGDVARALDDHPADMLFTDPPYGVSYVGGTAKKLTLVNDDLTPAKLAVLLEGSLSTAAEQLAPGAAFYVCSPTGDLETVFRLALRTVDLQLRQAIVWVKDGFVLGRSDYHGQHEGLLYGWTPGADPVQPPTHFEPGHETLLYGWAAGAAHTWEGGRKQSTVWEHPKPRRSEEHPTMKPVDLVRRAIENNTRPGALVLDTFAGSGTTLIACSDSGRRASLVELDPKYVHVICRRYQEHTGEVPVLERTGDQVSFLEAA